MLAFTTGRKCGLSAPAGRKSPPPSSYLALPHSYDTLMYVPAAMSYAFLNTWTVVLVCSRLNLLEVENSTEDTTK